MFKQIFLTFLILVMFATGAWLGSPLQAKAQTINREAIRAEIRSLLDELRGLRDRLDQLLAKFRGGDSSVNQTEVTEAVQQTQDIFHTISSGLTVGDKGDDVLALQRFLNTSADTRLAASGTNAPGQETGVYDAATQEAVVKFQEKYNVAAVVMILRELKKASSTALLAEPQPLTGVLERLANLFGMNSGKQTAQVGGATAAGTLMYIEGVSGCIPDPQKPIILNAAGAETCYKKSGDQCQVVGTGPVILTCGTAGSGGAVGGVGTSYYAVSPTVTKCDRQACGGADFIVGNVSAAPTNSNTGGAGSGAGGGAGGAGGAGGSQNPLTSFIQKIMTSLLGKKLGSSQLGQFLTQGLSTVAGLQSQCSKSGQSCPQSQAVAGAVTTSPGSVAENKFRLQNEGRSTAALGSLGNSNTPKAGVAGVCYNQGCTVMMTVDPSTGAIKLKSVPEGAKFFNNVNL